MTDMENLSVNSGQAKSGNNFFSGFLLGVLIGAAVVFLFVTKKGKKILKAISEGGEGKLSNILNKIENSVDLEDESLDEEASFAEAPTIKENQVKKKIVAETRPKTARRFFRGISRHVN